MELKVRIFTQEECLKSFEVSEDVTMTVKWDLRSYEIKWRKMSCRLRCVLELRFQIGDYLQETRCLKCAFSRLTQHALCLSFLRMLAAGVQSTVIDIRYMCRRYVEIGGGCRRYVEIGGWGAIYLDPRWRNGGILEKCT